jgi:hypothetical protein
MSTRYVTYYRVSTRKQGESGLGLDAQREAVRTFIGGGELVSEHEEVESGGRADRPALEAALRDCRRHRATLVIAKLDRLARSVSFIGCVTAFVVAIAVVILCASVARPAEAKPDAALRRGDYWSAWIKATHALCPHNRLEAVGYSDLALDLVDDFDGLLTGQDDKKVQAIADYSKRCRAETGGWTCYLAVHVDAYRRLGLMKKFAAFSCEQYQCDDDGICTSRRRGSGR